MLPSTGTRRNPRAEPGWPGGALNTTHRESNDAKNHSTLGIERGGGRRGGRSRGPHPGPGPGRGSHRHREEGRGESPRDSLVGDGFHRTVAAGPGHRDPAGHSRQHAGLRFRPGFRPQRLPPGHPGAVEHPRPGQRGPVRGRHHHRAGQCLGALVRPPAGRGRQRAAKRAVRALNACRRHQLCAQGGGGLARCRGPGFHWRAGLLAGGPARQRALVRHGRARGDLQPL